MRGSVVNIVTLVLVLQGQVEVHGRSGYPDSAGSLLEKNFSRVDVHRKTSTWMEAMEICRRQNSFLLCYTESSHVSQVAAELTFLAFPKMWIRNRNCSEPVSEPNLSVDLKNMNFTRSGVKSVTKHSFHKEHHQTTLPFICFKNVSSSRSPSALMHSPATDDPTTEGFTNNPEPIVICDEPKLGSGVTSHDCEKKTPGENCTFKCDIGMFPKNNGLLTCNKDGQFDGIPECEEYCSEPSVTNHAWLLGNCDQMVLGGTCSFICPKTYTPMFGGLLNCHHGGKWDGEADCKRPDSYNGSMFAANGTFWWFEGQEQCRKAGGELACENPNEDKFFEEVLPVIIPFSSGNETSFWYAGRKCDANSDQANSYMTVYNIYGKPFKRTSASSQEKYYALCSKQSSSTSPPPPTTTSTSTSTTTTTITTTSTTASTTMEPTSSTTTTQSTSTVVSNPLCCPAKTARGINWERHCNKSENVFRKCPEGSVGNATWFCNTAKGEWSPATPTLEDCKSTFMDDLASKVNKSNVIEALDILGEKDPLYGGDLLGIGNILSEVVKNVEKFLELVDDSTARKELSLNITNKVATLGDNLLSDKNTWRDLTKESRVQAATELLQDKESAAFQCAYNLDAQDVKSFEKKTFSMQIVKNEKGSYKNGLTLPRGSGYASSPTSKFVLPPDFEDAIPDNINHTIVVFFEYKDLGDILVTNPDHSSGSINSSSAVNSPVLSVSLNDGKLKVKFETRAHFFVPHTSTNAERPVCAFWNITSLNWEDEGCEVVETDDTQTECACDHLTNFAVLMDVHDVLGTLSEEDLSGLETITLIGCIISIVFLSIAIIVTTVYRKLWGMRNSVHRNLCISLVIAEVLLVSGGDGTEIKVLCSVIAGLLHYFFTAAFCWMFLEAVVIYLLLYKVFSPKKSYTKRFYAFGYGVPLLIVAISAASRPSGYGSDKACWLNTEKGIRWSFVAPVAFILTVNVVALVYALVVAVKSNKRNQSKQGSPVTRTWILGALTLAPLLGSTWILGFVMVRNEPVFVYIFTVLNSLQGAAIFIVQCLLHQNSRKCLVKSIGKYTHLIPVGSLVSSSNRSTSQTEAQRRSASRQSRSRQGSVPPSAPPMDPPSSNGRTENKPKRTFPAFLRKTRTFELSPEERADGSDIRYSASVSDSTDVILKCNHRAEDSC